MIRKFFPLDKNYLLEEAQLSLQHALLSSLVEKVKIEYELRHNPLGLLDTFSQKINCYCPGDLPLLSNFYLTLSGIYRFKYGNNQLELLWSGESHFEKYKQEWAAAFDQWTTKFCGQEQFIQAILDLTVFLPENNQAQLAENRMNFVMLQFCDVKVHKTKGIVGMRLLG